MLKNVSLALFTALPLLAIDIMPQSTIPPAGLDPSEVPQFIVLGSDDNGQIDGLTWFTELLESTTNPTTNNPQQATFDGDNANASFYVAGNALENDSIVTLFKRLYSGGFEISNHTYTHVGSVEIDWKKSEVTKRLTVAEYIAEVERCNDSLVSKVGMQREEILGFRTPFVAYSDTCIQAVKELGMLYDCSIMSGHESWGNIGEAGTYFWPYTLESGSKSTEGNWYNVALDLPVGTHEGIWEMPPYMFSVPSDDLCEQYLTEVGLRARVGKDISWSDGSKADGVDFNLWDQYKLNKSDVLAILKYTLHKMYNGNRSPMHYVIHSDFYTDSPYYSESFPSIPDYLDRRAIIEEFLEYAVTLPDVRIVSSVDVIEWMRNPVPLDRSIATSELVTHFQHFTLSNTVGESISIETPTAGAYTMTVMDLRGRVIAELKQNLHVGSNSIDISMLNVAQQLYIVSVTGVNGAVVTERMLLK